MGEMDEVDRQTYWAGRRVLITGATGFIGTMLTQALISFRADVHILATDLPPHLPFCRIEAIRRAVTVHLADIRSADQVALAVVEAEPQTIFHLAAISQVTDASQLPRTTFEINTMGLVNLLEPVRHLRVCPAPTVVIASSDKAFGEGEFDFRSAGRPKHPYDTSKLAADVIAAGYRDWAGMPIRILRSANTYGPYDVNWKRIIPGTIRAAVEYAPVILRSDGSPVREYVFIRDVIEAYLRLAEFSGDDDYGETAAPYVLGGAPISVADLVNKILWLMASACEVIVTDTAKDESNYICLRTSGPTTLLEAVPQTSLEVGLPATIAWTKQWLVHRGRTPP